MFKVHTGSCSQVIILEIADLSIMITLCLLVSMIFSSMIPLVHEMFISCPPDLFYISQSDQDLQFLLYISYI